MINYMAVKDVYPTMGDESLGGIATGDLLGPTPGEVEAGTSEIDQALTIGGQANPLVGALVFLLLLVATMWVMHRLGREGDFSNIKASAYNALVIGWTAILTIPVFKFLFTKIKLPGVSTWVHSV